MATKAGGKWENNPTIQPFCRSDLLLNSLDRCRRCWAAYVTMHIASRTSDVIATRMQAIGVRCAMEGIHGFKAAAVGIGGWISGNSVMPCAPPSTSLKRTCLSGRRSYQEGLRRPVLSHWPTSYYCPADKSAGYHDGLLDLSTFKATSFGSIIIGQEDLLEDIEQSVLGHIISPSVKSKIK